MGLDKLKAKADRTAMIAHMSAAVKSASDRWEKVGEVYKDAWTDALDAHTKVLTAVANAKARRETAALDRIKSCLDLACVFLPILGGPAAIALAPILTARAKLLASTLQKRATAAWTAFAAASPTASRVVKEIGTRSAKHAQDAATKIGEDVIKRLAPKYATATTATRPTDPVGTFKDNNDRTEDEMNKWVESCAAMNARDDFEAELVPVAYDLFLNHPWVKTAPAVDTTLNQKAGFTRLIEVALWLRWARHLDEKHWKKVHDWYADEYLGLRTRDGKNAAVTGSGRRLATDAIDFAPVWTHFRWNYRRVFTAGMMRVLDPTSGLVFAEVDTIDLYTLIRAAKKSSAEYALRDAMPGARVDPDLLRELKTM